MKSNDSNNNNDNNNNSNTNTKGWIRQEGLLCRFLPAQQGQNIMPLSCSAPWPRVLYIIVFCNPQFC